MTGIGLRGVTANIIEAANALEDRLRAEADENADELLLPIDDGLPIVGPGQVERHPQPTLPNQPRPSPFVTQAAALGSHFIRVTHSANLAVGLLLTGTIRLARSGEIVSIGEQGLGAAINDSGDRNVHPDLVVAIPADCEVLSLRVVSTGTNIVPGTCYVLIERVIVLQDGVTSIPVQAYIQNYVTNFQPVFWPGGRCAANSLEGAGVFKNIVLSNPALGADYNNIFVPIGAQFKIVSIICQLNIIGAAVTVLVFSIENSGWQVNLTPSGGIAAGFYTFSMFADAHYPDYNAITGNNTAAGRLISGLPKDFTIGPLGKFFSGSNIGAGDQFQAGVIRVEEHLLFQS